MNRKKIAILLPWMKMGGTNKVALGFIKELTKYCDVTLILTSNTGELLEELPSNINLIVDPMKDFKTIFYRDLTLLKLVSLCKDLMYYLKIKLGKDSIDNFRYLVDRNTYITDIEFDCAISYHGQSPERLLNLLYRIHSKKKVVWIHGEFNKNNKNNKLLKKYYNMIDYFFFVSKSTRESYTNIFPLDYEKSEIYYNRIYKEDILLKSVENMDIEFSKDCINIVTVGRLSKEKGQDMVPKITRNLIDKGYNICWYLIGEGDTRNIIEKNIKDNCVENNVILLGVKNNPYCYMANCDIYVQPSYTEGFSTTICEAAILGKAIIGTKPSGGIKEQIIDGYDGLIVGATVEELEKGIASILDNENLKEKFEENIKKKDFEFKNEIFKFLNVLNKRM